MTKEEAIEILQDEKANLSFGDDEVESSYPYNVDEALIMAIEALKQPVINISCFYEPQSNGGCIGLGNGDDDEPIDRCKVCPLHYIVIEEREALQQPEIVRCGECKYFTGCHKRVSETIPKRTSDTPLLETVYRDISFCSRGERKDGAE